MMSKKNMYMYNTCHLQVTARLQSLAEEYPLSQFEFVRLRK